MSGLLGRVVLLGYRVGVGAIALYAIIQALEKAYGRKLTFKEEAWFFRHPNRALAVKNTAIAAYAMTAKIFNENGDDNESDAFRHCFWSATLARDIGVSEAREFTSLHEDSPTNPAARKLMDLTNNAKGLTTKFVASDDNSIAIGVLKMLRDGELMVIKPNGNKGKAP